MKLEIKFESNSRQCIGIQRKSPVSRVHYRFSFWKGAEPLLGLTLPNSRKKGSGCKVGEALVAVSGPVQVK